MRTLHRKYVALLAAWAMVVGLSGCATGPRIVDHSFGFDALYDTPEVVVLDYQYGSSNHPGARGMDPSRSSNPESFGYINTSGPIPVDFLYVKWRVKQTGRVYEDRVDLRNRLPDDIVDHRVYFIVMGPQLYVYLVSPDPLRPNPCPSKEELRRFRKSDAAYDRVYSRYCYRKITPIYPNKSSQ
jgi:hypothetical protein